ncbi:predicted protein [Sclerotinia sclerotiorum 1980 UF-70]|uniref:Uncharacterized protein n=1 Tax=Sclerotinia sclerotiorum (strain ATCC 18683 / 1980 / Ss-1) TaxID=665079 RepID=A7E5U6_SCLS1|nr:predicted protein [Sclerotinia sclerotiorum 1980 UF-70]EDN91268.1 predicted protein [Sclerotinia sclerotiorum 1980 UF-70]
MFKELVAVSGLARRFSHWGECGNRRVKVIIWERFRGQGFKFHWDGRGGAKRKSNVSEAYVMGHENERGAKYGFEVTGRICTFHRTDFSCLRSRKFDSFSSIIKSFNHNRAQFGTNMTC